MSDIGTRWRKTMNDLMQQTHTSYRQLAAKAGVDHTTLWRQIKGKTAIRLEEADRLLGILGGGLGVEAAGARATYVVFAVGGEDELLAVVVARSPEEARHLAANRLNREARTLDTMLVDVGSLRVLTTHAQELTETPDLF